MAVDTETKRRSAIGATLAFLAIAPLSDGTIGAVDREHILGIYAGIAPGAPAAGIARPRVEGYNGFVNGGLVS